MVQTYIASSSRRLLCTFFFLCSVGAVLGQLITPKKYWVFFKDKHATTFDPYAYFEPSAIQRRLREGLSLSDSTDFPLNPHYVGQLKDNGIEPTGYSRWLNAAICVVSEDQLSWIENLSYVSLVQPVATWQMEPCLHASGDFDLELLEAQTKVMGYPAFMKQELNGSGVTIAVFDAGFKGTINNAQLQHLIDRKQIKATYNFVTDRNFVFDYNSHGTMVLSCIAGMHETTTMGCASGAQFLLARTEQTNSESQIEEDNWIRSLEWADQQGADIVNSSLGYTYQLYRRKDMTGQTHLMAKAANQAFSKGILIVNSAGNEGNSWWEIIAGPADSDSILTVGGIDPMSGLHHPESSYGPNVNGQLKPNVSAFFAAIVSAGGQMERAEGTSFSSPLVAGFAACVKQLHPEWTVRRLYDEIQKSGHLYPYFDYAHGYGVPQASYFVDSAKVTKKEIELIYHAPDDSYHIQLCDLFPSSFMFDSQASAELKNYVYYHLCDSSGQVMTYNVVMPEDFNGAILEKTNCDECLIRIHYKNQTIETTRQKIRQLQLDTNALD